MRPAAVNTAEAGDRQRSGRLWPQIRPWVVASLAGVASTILICVAEIVHPRTILDLHHYFFGRIWPAGLSFRGVHVRAGVPFLAFAAAYLAPAIRRDAELDGFREYAAYFLLSKSFAGIFLVPQAIVYAAIQAKAGWYGWSSVLGPRHFDIPLFVEQMLSCGFFPLQSVAFGFIAYGIKRDRNALVAAGIGGAVSFLLFLPAILPGYCRLAAPTLHPGVPFPQLTLSGNKRRL